MSKKIRLAGRRVLNHLQHHIELDLVGENEMEQDPLLPSPVIAVRRYISDNWLSGKMDHALFRARSRDKYYNFYWCSEKGLFDIKYVEKYFFLFPYLRLIVDRIGEDELFEGLYLAIEDWDEVWEEIGKIPDS